MANTNQNNYYLTQNGNQDSRSNQQKIQEHVCL